MSAFQRPVFHDPAGRRWRHVRAWGIALGVLASVLGAVFVTSVVVHPFATAPSLRAANLLPLPEDLGPQLPAPPDRTRAERAAKRAARRLRAAGAASPRVPAQRRSQIRPIPGAASTTGPLRQGDQPLAIGFYVNWDDSSWSSLKRNLDRLDAVFPEWIRLAGPEVGAGVSPIVVDVDARVVNLIRSTRPQVAIVPLLQNYRDEKWDPAGLVRAIGTPAARTALIAALVELVETNGFSGLCLDLEEVPPRSQRDLMQFVGDLHETFRSRGWVLAQAVPFDDPAWRYPEVARRVDLLLLMAYDQHWSSGEAGPIAGQDWFERTLERRLRELDPSRTVVCIGGYGFDWTRGHEATEVTFQEAMLTARDSSAAIQFDPVSRNPHFGYREDGRTHTVWFLDAVTASEQIRVARHRGVRGLALWRLGAEDPSLWAVFGDGRWDAPWSGLETIRYGYDVDFEGTGEILQVVARPSDGVRGLTVDPATGALLSETYRELPSSWVIRRGGDHPGKIALTFDDGPDPEWTPRILDVLRREGVRATFFVIGENGQAHPDLVQRIYDEGHDLGNHTFTHPNLGEIPERLTTLELDATQRLIEAIVGRSTVLFRAPYFGDAEPQTPDEVAPAAVARDLGYVAVGVRIDPDDWKLETDDGRPRTADDIVSATVAGALATDPDVRGQVVLLHDGGGDRERTLEALPRIIETLRAKGFEFVPVSELAGFTRDEAMPLVPGPQGWLARVDAVVFRTLSIAGWMLRWVFVIGIVLGVARVLLVGSLALVQTWRSRARERGRAPAAGAWHGVVSILVPAFREERVIAATIESLRRQSWGRFEVLVIDDGSPDRTSQVARDAAGDDPRIRVVRQPNAGKAAALDLGLRETSGDIVVALDADTLFPPETIGRLAARFADPRVGAVAGNAKVGNRINLVTRWQALEYVSSQNLDRRAFALLDCITVVPGAVGAWRRSALEEVGGFHSDTLAEDQDLTIRVRRRGWRVDYAEDAIAWTEAPDTWRGLLDQRFRWSFGTLQCMWKHRDALLRPRYGTLGLIALPNVWIFQVLFALVAPLVDLTMAWTLASAALERIEHPGEAALGGVRRMLFYYAVFLAVDWLGAAWAFLLERREQWSLLWALGLQRFGYRQVVYWVMLRSVAVAARGALVGWGSLERKATAEIRAA